MTFIDSLKKGVDHPMEKFTIDQQDKYFVGSTVHVDGYIAGSIIGVCFLLPWMKEIYAHMPFFRMKVNPIM